MVADERALFTMLHLKLIFDLCGPDGQAREAAVEYVHSEQFAALCGLLGKQQVPAKMQGIAKKTPQEREEYLEVLFMRRRKGRR
jgi:hypothetical protein